MVNVARNLCLYPNVYLMDQFSSQIRQYRPIAVDKTEVTIHCIAPVGESAQARAARIRRYEDFFNATGMATPDDLEEFRACQNGFLAAPSAPWNDMSRGATHWIEGPDEHARAMGITRCAAASRWKTRACTRSSTGYWLTAMQQAVVADAKSARRSSRRKGTPMVISQPSRWSSSFTARRACWTTANSRAGWTATRRTRLLDAVLVLTTTRLSTIRSGRSR